MTKKKKDEEAFGIRVGDKVSNRSIGYRWGRTGEVVYITGYKLTVKWLTEEDGSPLKNQAGVVIKKPTIRRIHALMVQKL